MIEDRWLDVFAGQQRLPGEWGHWSGQGMNWNANCAYCHTTEFDKGFDFAANHYHSTWTQQGVACAACHSGLEQHVKTARAGNPSAPLPRLDKTQIEHNCASCHSRREQLSADKFTPGADFHDHFALSLPDHPGLYHHDGQILEEDFVYGSFQMSRMAHAGVTCLDCHNPHSLEPILPVENNMLCLRCHENGANNAPIIQPTEHSFHPHGSSGNRCVACHMPETTYMQVDPRADHAFLSPDPLLTKELGIPNPGNKAQSDKSVAWPAKGPKKWYGANQVGRRAVWGKGVDLGVGGIFKKKKNHIESHTEYQR